MGKKKHTQHHTQGTGENDPGRDLHKEAIKAVLAEMQAGTAADVKKSQAPSSDETPVAAHKKEQGKPGRKHTPRPVRWSVRGIVGGLVITGVATAFLATNIVASQLMVPSYSRLVNGDRASWVALFKAAADRDDALPLIQEYKGRYREFADEINRESLSRRERITYLESELQRNPEARDILYALSILYRREGDLSRADDFLSRARAIDPAVGR